jgi:hypothetical protein
MTFTNNLSRWHPEVALRYLPIVSAIKNLGIKDSQTLEVGSGPLGIAPYLGRPITGLDTDFTGSEYPLLKRIVGSAQNLPFPNRSFDVVLLVDVLEHISPDLRPKTLSEALRCARKAVFLTFPEGPLALNQDRKLASIVPQKVLRESEKTSRKAEFFKQHLSFPLPRTDELVEMIKNCARDENREVEIKLERNENLKLRGFLMRGWLTDNLLVDIIFRKLFIILIPLFENIKTEPSYRQIIKIYLN